MDKGQYTRPNIDLVLNMINESTNNSPHNKISIYNRRYLNIIK